MPVDEAPPRNVSPPPVPSRAAPPATCTVPATPFFSTNLYPAPQPAEKLMSPPPPWSSSPLPASRMSAPPAAFTPSTSPAATETSLAEPSFMTSSDTTSSNAVPEECSWPPPKRPSGSKMKSPTTRVSGTQVVGHGASKVVP